MPAAEIRPFVLTQVGLRAKANVINAAVRQRRTGGSYRCTACKGRCEVTITYTTRGTVKHSRGQCSTRGCIAWEE
ncbi:hypothetical protein [Dyella sp.]|uniref:hypothetical protein n=1 Tax=Dyella sp. TaxID=1869338 RepID=UPI003F7D4578